MPALGGLFNQCLVASFDALVKRQFAGIEPIPLKMCMGTQVLRCDTVRGTDTSRSGSFSFGTGFSFEPFLGAQMEIERGIRFKPTGRHARDHVEFVEIAT